MLLGVDDERLRVAEVSHDAEDLRAIDEALSSLIAVLQTEGDDTAEASLEVAVADLMMLIRLQTRVVHPSDLRLALEPTSDLKCRLRSVLDAKRERLKTLDKDEAIRGTQAATEARSPSTRARTMKAAGPNVSL